MSAVAAPESSATPVSSDAPGDDLLVVEALTQRFGGVVAVADLDFAVARGSITAVIGPNGAGKTTLFNCVTGIYAPTHGAIRFDGRPLTGLPPHAVAEAGIARTFQNIRLFGAMTVLENVLVGAYCRTRAHILSTLVASRLHRREEEDEEHRAFAVLDLLGLGPDADRIAGALPYGHQRRLEIARALATRPKLLLLDEPAAGLNPSEKEELKGIVRRIRDTGITIVLIDHDMKLVMDLSEQVVVLDYGRKIAQGNPREVRENPAVVEAYLGSGHGKPHRPPAAAAGASSETPGAAR